MAFPVMEQGSCAIGKKDKVSLLVWVDSDREGVIAFYDLHVPPFPFLT